MGIVLRRLLNALTVLSLLASVAVAVVWAQAYARERITPFEEDGIWDRWSSAQHHALALHRGKLIYRVREWRPPSSSASESAVSATSNRSRVVFAIQLPLAIAVTAFAIPPALWSWGHVKSRRRRPPGFCPSCGYDLTGNVSGVCPECGEKP